MTAKELSRLRLNAGLSQSELGVVLKVLREKIVQWEQGWVAILDEDEKRIQEAFDRLRHVRSQEKAGRPSAQPTGEKPWLGTANGKAASTEVGPAGLLNGVPVGPDRASGDLDNAAG